MAPEARIVMVKTDFQDAHIIDGIQYVFRVARDLGLPAVVNLSLGGHFDAHDGTDPMSIAIEEESGPGRIVCCAAGNEGDDDLHARFNVNEGAVRAVPCHAGSSGGAPDMFWLNGWYPGGARLEIAVESPSGVATAFQPVKTSGSPVHNFDVPEGAVQIVTPDPTRPTTTTTSWWSCSRPEPAPRPLRAGGGCCCARRRARAGRSRWTCGPSANRTPTPSRSSAARP